MYLVKALTTARGEDFPGSSVDWISGQCRFVHDKCILPYLGNPSAFTVISGPDEVNNLPALLATCSGETTGLVVPAGCIASDIDTVVHQTTLTLTDLEVPVTDAQAFGNKKLYTFPAGRIMVLGLVASIQWAVKGLRTTINDNASLTWGIGSAAASNITLSSTMIDLLPKTTKVLSAATTAYNTASAAALAAAAQFATGVEAYLNTGFETNTDIDADGILKATGTIKMTWVNLG